MAFDINSTRSLLGVINRAYPPNPLLVNTFFPNAITYSSEYLDVDFKKRRSLHGTICCSWLSRC